MSITIEKRYLDMDECSEYLGISKATLYIWVCRRKIPYTKMGRLVKFDIKELGGWLKRRSVADFN